MLETKRAFCLSCPVQSLRLVVLAKFRETNAFLFHISGTQLFWKKRREAVWEGTLPPYSQKKLNLVVNSFYSLENDMSIYSIGLFLAASI